MELLYKYQTPIVKRRLEASGVKFLTEQGIQYYFTTLVRANLSCKACRFFPKAST